MIEVRMVTHNGLYKKTTAKIISAISEDGQRGILPSHMPLVMTLKISRLEMEEEKREVYAVAGGMLYFKDDKCTILSPAIENKTEIDLDRAYDSKKRAMERLENKNGDLKRAELSLKRALNRIDVKTK